MSARSIIIIPVVGGRGAEAEQEGELEPVEGTRWGHLRCTPPHGGRKDGGQGGGGGFRVPIMVGVAYVIIIACKFRHNFELTSNNNFMCYSYIYVSALIAFSNCSGIHNSYGPQYCTIIICTDARQRLALTTVEWPPLPVKL